MLPFSGEGHFLAFSGNLLRVKAMYFQADTLKVSSSSAIFSFPLSQQPAMFSIKEALPAWSRGLRCPMMNMQKPNLIKRHRETQPILSDTTINFLLLKQSKPTDLLPHEHLAPHSMYPTGAEF